MFHTRNSITLLGVALLALAGCSKQTASTPAAAGSAANALATPAETAATPTASPGQAPAPARPKIKFRVQEVLDAQQGGLVACRYLVPADWKADGKTVWNYGDLYTPWRRYTRAEAPDGSAWVETYPYELFYWLDPRWDNFKARPNPRASATSGGGIHHRNIQTLEAMQRYIIARYRGRVRNLQMVGYRPVKNLPQALGWPAQAGEGIDIRVRYLLGNEPVDEEFFGLMTPVVTIPYHGPQGTTYEYHRVLGFLHSLGAKNGKLDSMRPLLGYIASTFKTDQIWEKHMQAVTKQLLDAYDRNLAAGYAQIEAAGRLSRSISANNDAMIRSMDAQRAAANRPSARPQVDPYHASEEFDQYVRGAEKMQDSSGQVSEQSYMYSYHWTDGRGTYVHSNDATFDPNAHSNQSWEKMKPAN